MVNIRKINPAARAIGTVGAVVVLAGGVTFAALNSQATLTDNQISSATATLQVDNNENGPGFGSTDLGYDFLNLVPGGASSAAHSFSLRNFGTTDLDVTVYATSVAATGSLDKSKVKVTFNNVTTADSATYSLAQLEALFNNVPGAGNQSNGTVFLAQGAVNDFTVSVQLDAGAVTGSGPADVNGFDFVFTGTNEAEVVAP